MKQKGLLFCLVCILSICFLTLPAHAVEAEDFRSFSGSDALWEAIPSEETQESVRALWGDSSPANGLGAIGAALRSAFSIGLGRCARFFGGMGVMLLLGAVMNAWKSAGSKKLFETLDFLFLLILALWSYSFLTEGVEITSAFMTVSSSFLTAALPVQTLLLEMGGAGLAGAVQSTHLNFVIALFGAVNSFVVLPLIRASYALSLASSLAGSGLKGIAAICKKWAKTALILLFTILSAMLTLQNAVASASDSVKMRAVRFAAGNFIPVVGNLVGAGARELSVAWKAVKTECGVLCFVVLLFLVLRPALFLFLQKSTCALLAGFAEMLGMERENGFLQGVASTLDLMLALVIAQGCYLLFYIALFLKTEGCLTG